MDHWEELGGGASVFLLSIGYGYSKFIDRKLEGIQNNIKQEHNGDREQYRKIKRDLKQAIKDIHDIEVKVAYKRTKLDNFEQRLDEMILGLEAQEKRIIENAHKIELNDRDVKNVKDIIKDILEDVKEFQTRSNNMEMSLAKMLGALSRNFD